MSKVTRWYVGSWATSPESNVLMAQAFTLFAVRLPASISHLSSGAPSTLRADLARGVKGAWGPGVLVWVLRAVREADRDTR